MLRAKVAMFVIAAFSYAVAIGVYAGVTLLAQWMIRSGGAFWPTFLTLVCVLLLVRRSRA